MVIVAHHNKQNAIAVEAPLGTEGHCAATSAQEFADKNSSGTQCVWQPQRLPPKQAGLNLGLAVNPKRKRNRVASALLRGWENKIAAKQHAFTPASVN